MASQVLHNSLPPFAPAIPVAALPFLALVLLSATFGLAFYFTTSVSLPLPSPLTTSN